MTDSLAAAMVLFAGIAHGASLVVPNGSFESQPAVAPFFANTFMDSWQKNERPVWFPETGYNGFFWDQTAGVFLDSNPYTNRDGNQCAYLLGFPQAGFFQDYTSMDWNDAVPSNAFAAVFTPGKSYSLSLGVYGKGLPAGAQLQLSMYYLDGGNNKVTVGFTTATYAAAQFPAAGPFSLVDYTVNVPEVLPSDAWAGKHIGIKIESVTGDGNGYWDMDNLRLSEIPEPSGPALLAIGAGTCLLRRRVRR
jgi:hypothetical protein